MRKDPIVSETRKAGEKLAEEANFDLHTFFENMRAREKQFKEKTAPKTKYKSHSRLDGVVREK